MPKLLEAFSTKQAPISIGTKADFIRLQVRHAVAGSDSEAIRKCVEAIEDTQPRMAEIRAYIVPHRELVAAVKTFKSKYAHKHPKFIAAVEADFVEPVDKIIEIGTDWLKQAGTLPTYFLETLKPLEDLVDTLTSNQLSDQILRTAETQLAGAGSSYNNAISNLNVVNENFNIPILREVADKAKLEQHKFEVVDRILQGARKTQNYSVDLMPVVGTLGHMTELCKTFANAVARAAH